MIPRSKCLVIYIFYVLCVIFQIKNNVHAARELSTVDRLGNALNTIDFNRVLSTMFSNRRSDIPEDAILTTPQLITKYGYPVEVHDNIKTEDGYILTMHRIPYGLKSGPAENKPVVFVQAGFFSNSGDAIITGPESALGYYLADAGFDVWLGNTRGSRYCTKHMYTSRKNKKYWDYSWSDIGYYDIPAMVDYVLNNTNEEKLFYIGHSRGTTAFFVMCSTRPEYNAKIRAMAAMAPVSFMTHVPNPLFHILAHNIELLQRITEMLNIYQVTMNNIQLIEMCGSTNTINNLIQPEICTLLFFTLGGFDYSNFNRTVIPIMLGHVPDSFSIKELTHFGQSILSGKFRNFNYGQAQNILKYNLVEPPEYDLSKVTVPVMLFYSGNDLQSSVVDVEQLAKLLPNVIGKFQLNQGPNHFSYFNGMNAREMIYTKIMKIFAEY